MTYVYPIVDIYLNALQFTERGINVNYVYT